MKQEYKGKVKKFSFKRLIYSFGYAFCGFRHTLKYEQNMRIHVLVALIVVLFGFLFHINQTEWLICLLFIGLVMAMELINTSIEATIDLISPQKHPLAKIAKDTAASAVMVFAFAAAIAGSIIFVPKIIELF